MQKAEEGVRVCLMVWDDKTSVHVGAQSAGGLMMTHDEETRAFFKGTKVCHLSHISPSAFTHPLPSLFGSWTKKGRTEASTMRLSLLLPPSRIFGFTNEDLLEGPYVDLLGPSQPPVCT